MMKNLAGVLLAAVLLFIWGFLYWGISTVPYTAWAHTADDRAAQQALHQHFPTSGTYYVPSPRLPAAQLQALRAGGGPNSMLHVQYNAPSRGDPIELAKGLLLNLLFAAALALLMYRVRSASRTYAGRLGVALWAGVAGVLLIDGGDWVWWAVTPQWKMYQAIYDFSAFVLVGAVLAAFIKTEARTTRFS